MNPNQQRKEKYFQLSSQLAQMEDSQIVALLEVQSIAQHAGWGRHQTIEIGETKLFVKRVPLTALEQQNSFSTQNLYDLPAYYHYGLGSAGLGVYREVVAHIKTTNWVLSGEIENFPLMVHYRVMPFSGERAVIDMASQQRYVQYWGGNAQIGQYMLDRANAQSEIVIFLEHIPYTVQPWLQEHPDQVQRVVEDLRSTLDFLGAHGIIHFDAHFHNVLTDGEKVYLTDFGLVLDKSFSLQEDEAALFDSHIDYDTGHLFWNLVFPIFDLFNALPKERQSEIKEKYGVPEKSYFHTLLFALLENIEELQRSSMSNMNETYLAYLLSHRTILTLLGNFYSTLQSNPQKDTPFPHEELRRLLNEAGFSKHD